MLVATTEPTTWQDVAMTAVVTLGGIVGLYMFYKYF